MFTAVLVIHVITAATGGAWLLSNTSSPRTIGMPRLLAVVLWLGLLGTIELLGAAGLGFGLFGWIHLVYLDLLLVLPGLALLSFKLAFQNGGGMTHAARLTCALFLLTVPVLSYATFIEPFDLCLEESTVPITPKRSGPKPLRIGVLSDLQARRVGNHERRAVNLLLANQPDIILIPGDVIHQTNRTDYSAVLPEFRRLLSRLEAPGGVFFVQGNTDPQSQLDELVRGTNLQLLRDKIVRFEYAGWRIAIGGLDLDHHQTKAGRALIAELERQDDPAELRLVLSHRPDAIWALAKSSRIDLVVSGHTHGGQVQIPFFGPPITLSSVPRHVAKGGLHKVDGRRVYVSRGVGVERGFAPRIRFLAPPEISLLTLAGS